MLNATERKRKKDKDKRKENPMRFNNTEVLKVALVFTMEKPEWSCWSESGR